MRLPLACFTSVVRSSTAAKSAFFQRRSVFLTLAKGPSFSVPLQGLPLFPPAFRFPIVPRASHLSPLPSRGLVPRRTKLQDPPKFRFPALPRPSRLCPPGRRYPFFLPTFVPLPRGPPAGGTEGTLFVSSEGRFLFLFFRIHLFSCFMSLS